MDAAGPDVLHDYSREHDDRQEHKSYLPRIHREAGLSAMFGV